MKTLYLLTSISVAFFVLACNTVGEPVEFSNACKIENDKKKIEVSGILEDKGGIFCSNTSGRMECGYKLVQNAGDKNGISADIEVGSGKNSAEKPERGFKREDLKIRDNAGELVKIGEKVKLTGKLSVGTDANGGVGGVCFMQVYKIER